MFYLLRREMCFASVILRKHWPMSTLLLRLCMKILKTKNICLKVHPTQRSIQNISDYLIIFISEVSKICKPSVILCSSTMRLLLDDVFEFVTFKEVGIYTFDIFSKCNFDFFMKIWHIRIISLQRCIGLRFLYPVYCIPEVELTKSSDTSIITVDKCKQCFFFCFSKLLLNTNKVIWFDNRPKFDWKNWKNSFLQIRTWTFDSKWWTEIWKAQTQSWVLQTK